MAKIKMYPDEKEYKKIALRTNLIAVSTEISIDLDTPVSVYNKLVGEEKGYILESVDTSHQQFGRYSFIGAEPFIRLQVFKDHLMIKENDLMKYMMGSPVETIKKFISSYHPAIADTELPLANGGMIGYFNYEIVSTFDRVRGMDLDENQLLGQFMICRFMVIFDALKNVAKLILLTEATPETAELAYEQAAEKMEDLKNKIYAPVNHKQKEYRPRKDKVDFLKRYEKPTPQILKNIQTIKDHIFAGDIFQAVPSFRFTERITKPAFHFYRRLRQVNPSPYMFYLNFGRIKLVGASPERLVKVSGDKVFTYPIAGSRRRGSNDEEDLKLAADLSSDEKECAEHSMLVDLARNDIGRISLPGTVKVTKLRAIEKFSHVIHMVSEVVGTLRPEYSPMDVLKASFLAGTVSGAPKLRAMEIVNELEPVSRETYAGCVGYLDFCGNMDVCITLRTMRIEDDSKAFIQSGAGIVADSVLENEYKEFLQKSKALFEVVEELENDVITFR